MEIKRGRATFIDTEDNIHEGPDGLLNCGCKDPGFELIMHMDGLKEYTTVYRCNCGNQITVKTERDPEEQKWWM